MAGQTIDYDALAAQHGGTAAVDYDALAAQHGGTASAAPQQAQTEAPGFWSKVGSEWDAFRAHPGDAALGAAKQIPALFQSGLPKSASVSPGDQAFIKSRLGAVDSGKLQAPTIENAYQTIANFVTKRTSPTSEAQQAGATGANIAATAVNLPNLIRSLRVFGFDARPMVGRAATAVSEAVDPDITGAFSPRLAHLQRMLGKLGYALTKAPPEEQAAALGQIPVRPGEPAPAQPQAPAPAPEQPQASALGKVPAKVVRQSQALGPSARVLQQSQGLQQPVPQPIPAHEPTWPAEYQNSPQALTANNAGGANYTPADLAALKTRMGIAQPAEAPGQASQFPPRGPVVKVQYDPNRPFNASKPAGPEFDLKGVKTETGEDQAILDAMRHDLYRHGLIARMQANREFAAGMSMDTPKGVQIEQAKNLLVGGRIADIGAPVVGSPSAPVEMPGGLKLFKTGGQWFAKGGQWGGSSWTRVTADDLKSALSAATLQPSHDLTGVLQQSLDAVRKR